MTLEQVDRKFQTVWEDFVVQNTTLYNTQLLLSTIFWLSFSIDIFLNFFFNPLAIFRFREDINIWLYLIDDLHIPVITEDAIFPVPIKPNFIINTL